MELPRPRPYGSEGRNSSQVFLSLYPRSSSQQHPLPSSSQAAYLKTQNFLQPLEQLGKVCAEEEIAAPVQVSGTGKSTPDEHLLPGGIGTFSIRHVSNFNSTVPKAVPQTSNAEKNEDDSNCTSFLGGGFSLSEESAGKAGKTGKENAGESQWLGESTARIPSVSMERRSQSSSNNHHHNLSSLSSSQLTAQKNQRFMEIIKSAKGSPRDGEIDEEEEEEFDIKKETSPTIAGELRIKVDQKSSDQKANTPRSKHSATEQRRRSKINDRFQKLRELIPHSDQKRDKASFLLEVVEYIQVLQQKVDKYESSYQGLNHESRRLSPWTNNQRTADPTRAIHDHAGSYPAVVFAGKFIEKHVFGTSQDPVDSDTADHKVKVGNLLPPTTNEDLTIEADTNSISSVYSQGLLNSLTRTLQSSGVDLSKTSLSVQIELGTKTNTSAISSNSTVKDVEIPSTNLGSTRFRVAAVGDSETTMKKLKSGRS